MSGLGDDLERVLHGAGEHVAHPVPHLPGRLHFDATGRLQGAASITHNSPFPVVNGAYGSKAMNGVLMHTMVSDLPSAVSWFNNPAAQVSAHFGIAESGEIWQFGPVGKGWIAWHAMAANETYYGIEHADDGKPDTPLTDAQITASAQVVEALSAFAGFPLAITDEPGGKGYGTHAMGGAAFGGHSCPDLPPQHVRSQQRPVILALAKSIRAGGANVVLTTDGTRSLHQVAAAAGISCSHILRLSAIAEGVFAADVAEYINGVFAGSLAPGAPMPSGCKLWVPPS